MHGGGALILLAALGACLPAAPPDAARDAAADLPALVPMYAQDDLRDQGAPAIRGRATGTCSGTVRIEAGSQNQARPLAVTSGRLGPFVLHVPKDVPIQLRWGCDPDGDGTIAGDAVSVARIGAVSQDVPLDLFLPVPGVAAAQPLTVAPRRSARPLKSGAVLPTEGLAPPDAPAPADAAVGPPLPDGPSPDAGPPPTATTPPPPPAAP